MELAHISSVFIIILKDGEPHHSQCEMYVRNYTDAADISVVSNFTNEDTTPPGGSLKRVPCTSWDYDRDVFHSTLISEWNLVCRRDYLRSLIQSTFMFGVFIGAPLGGYLADRFGRKKLMTGALWVFILVSIGGSFSPYYPLFLFCRFLMAFTGNCVYQTSYILAVESCTERQRSIVGIMFCLPFAVGYMLLPGVAYLLRDWRDLHLAISVPVMLLIANTIILPESPRWLIQTGRIARAEKELQKAARWNQKKSLDSAWLVATINEIRAQALKEVKQDDSNSSSSRDGTNEDKTSSWKESAMGCFVFLRTPMLRRISCIMYFNWFTVTMVYYGISLSSSNYDTDPFLYMFLGGLIELPSYTLVVPFVAKYGRKKSLICFFVCCSIAILLLLVLPGARETWWFLCLVLLGKFSITSAYQIIYLYCCELYPTSLRTRGLGITSMMGRCGAIVSPFINDMLGAQHWSIPSVIFCGGALAAGLLTTLLPETNNRALPETVADIEGWTNNRNTNNKRGKESSENKNCEDSIPMAPNDNLQNQA